MIPKYFDLSSIIFLYFCNIVLYFVVFSWLVFLDKNRCQCSGLHYKRYIQQYIVFLFSIICLLYFFNEFEILKSRDNIFQLIVYILLIMQLIMLAIVFTYIKNIIKSKCTCEKTMCNISKMDIFIVLCSFVVIVVKFIS